MAKIVERSNNRERSLPPFVIESSDFVQIIERVFGKDAALTIEVGDSFYNKTAIMDGIDDVTKNISLLSGSFTVKVDELTISIMSSSSAIHYSEPQRPTVDALQAEFSAFVPYHRRIAQYVAIHETFFLCALLVIVLLLLLVHEDEISIWWALPIYPALLIFASVFWNKISQPKVFFSPRDSFLQRNKDKMVWGAISSIGTMLLSNFGNLMTYLTPGDGP